MIKIGDKTFKTKKEATVFIQEILYRYPLNNPLTGNDFTFVKELLRLHPERDNKVGSGIKFITVGMESKFNKTRCFFVTRNDDTTTDFSFLKCLSPSLNEPTKLFYSSARRVIADQIIYFRDQFFLANQDSKGFVKCQITGSLLGKNNSHVDHIPPKTFDKITSDFITLNNIKPQDIRFIEAHDGVGRVFADIGLIKRFSDYHKLNASLRIVTSTANLKQKKR